MLPLSEYRKQGYYDAAEYDNLFFQCHDCIQLIKDDITRIELVDELNVDEIIPKKELMEIMVQARLALCRERGK
jgi:hypothetical protein